MSSSEYELDQKSHYQCTVSMQGQLMLEWNGKHIEMLYKPIPNLMYFSKTSKHRGVCLRFMYDAACRTGKTFIYDKYSTTQQLPLRFHPINIDIGMNFAWKWSLNRYDISSDNAHRNFIHWLEEMQLLRVIASFIIGESVLPK